MNEGPLVILSAPGVDPGAYPLEQVRAAQERAFKLGLTARQGKDPLNSGTERLLDSKELAAKLGINDTTVEQMAKDGRLPSIRIGRLLRFEAAVCIARLRVTDGGEL